MYLPRTHTRWHLHAQRASSARFQHLQPAARRRAGRAGDGEALAVVPFPLRHREQQDLLKGSTAGIVMYLRHR